MAKHFEVRELIDSVADVNSILNRNNAFFNMLVSMVQKANYEQENSISIDEIITALKVCNEQVGVYSTSSYVAESKRKRIYSKIN